MFVNVFLGTKHLVSTSTCELAMGHYWYAMTHGIPIELVFGCSSLFSTSLPSNSPLLLSVHVCTVQQFDKLFEYKQKIKNLLNTIETEEVSGLLPPISAECDNLVCRILKYAVYWYVAYWYYAVWYSRHTIANSVVSWSL